MISKGTSQTILVSGESGAGKTESTKLLMRYLAYMSGRHAADGRSVEQKVLESNPVLEAFGNAKTVRNNNSSRFGKFVEIHFDQMGMITGAAIRTYLLERSRVCQVSDPERNYHCFYMLCAAPLEDIEKYKLGNPRKFHYLNQSNFYKLDEVDDFNEYLSTRKAMDAVGIHADEQDAIFRVVAAILHLGNVEFVKGDEADSSEPKDENSRFHLKTAAELFMCDEKSLEDSLCKRVIVTRGENIKISLNPTAAAISRDSLAKIIYSWLFDWLVNKINNSIGQDPGSKSLIGVLDIYGFESFETNSFEQFCINFTNEKLQQHFNQHVFKMEQEEYVKEEIAWSYIEFIDNQDVLDLIEKKPGGIIALLDEACMFPSLTHETFAQKLYQTFQDHKRFIKPKLACSDFTIDHYAGQVTYQTEYFLDKNKDNVVAEHQALLRDSKCSFISGLFSPISEDSGRSSKFSSIGSHFKQQLQALVETLNATEPHYIRCVKPNNALKPAIFQNNNVLQQLRCGGVMEAIRISCAGYPTRKTFDEFIDRFGILAPDVLNVSYDGPTTCKKLLEKAKLQGYQIGKTKVFLRVGQMAELDARRNEVLGRWARIIQRKFCTFCDRRSFILLRQSAINIQALCRGEIARHLYTYLSRVAACLKIQKHSTRFIARKAYKNLCSSAVSIQTGMRGMAARNERQFARKTRAAILIQREYRRYVTFLHYLMLKEATLITQCAWRRNSVNRELQKLKTAAYETGALQEAKSQMEQVVEQLAWSMELEKKRRELQLKIQETRALHIKEREAAKKAIEHVPTIQDVTVVDHEMVTKLTAENEMLKAMIISLEKRINETERKYEEARRLCDARLKQALEAETKITKLKTAMQRLEEQLAEMEFPQHQALSSSSKHLIVTSQKLQSSSRGFGTESKKTLRRSCTEQFNDNVASLIKSVEQNLGFSHGKPIAAVSIFKCLIHWRSFEAQKTSVFDCLIEMIGCVVQKAYDNDHMVYWLTNTSTLLCLLQCTLMESEKPPVPVSFLGKMTQVMRNFITSFRPPSSSASINIGKDTIQIVEAKYPALLFKQQLQAYVETIYGIIRENLKKDLAPLLSYCIQAASASEENASNCGPPSYWNILVETLDGRLTKFKENFVPAIFVQNIFTQIFSYINVQLFNSVILHPEFCTFNYGKHLKAGLGKLELWCSQAQEELVGSSWDELQHTRQAIEFLVTQEKPTISYYNITNKLCPVLSSQQLYKLCTLYRDDNCNTQSVSPEVLSSIKAQMNDSDKCLLLNDDNSSILFSVDEISSWLDKDFSAVKPASDLVQNPDFRFLQE